MSLEKPPLNERLNSRLDQLSVDIRKVVLSARDSKYPEEAIAAILSSLELLTTLMSPGNTALKPEVEARFLRLLHDGIRGISDGLSMGVVHERAIDRGRFAELDTSTLRTEFRNVLKKLLIDGPIGPTETTLGSEFEV